MSDMHVEQFAMVRLPQRFIASQRLKIIAVLCMKMKLAHQLLEEIPNMHDANRRLKNASPFSI
jgi:hypothetical protein